MACKSSCLWIVPLSDEMINYCAPNFILYPTQVKLCVHVFLLLFKNHYLELMYFLTLPTSLCNDNTQNLCKYTFHLKPIECLHPREKQNVLAAHKHFDLSQSPRSFYVISVFVVFSRCQSVRTVQLRVWICVEISWKGWLGMPNCNFTKFSPIFSCWKGWKAIKRMR